jgi:hypothetical protein
LYRYTTVEQVLVRDLFGERIAKLTVDTVRKNSLFFMFEILNVVFPHPAWIATHITW